MVKEIKTGDIIFTRDNNLIGKLIRMVTGGYYNHVAVVVGVHPDDYGVDSVLVAEAQWGGFVVTRYHKEYVFSSCGLGRVFDSLNEEQRKHFRSRVLQLLGSKYDFRALYKIFKVLVLGKSIDYEGANKVICSEAVAVIYNDFGTKFVDKPFSLVTPADIEKSSLISWVVK